MENPLSKSPIMPFHAIVTKIYVYKKFAKFVTKIMVTKFIVNQIYCEPNLLALRYIMAKLTHL